MRVFKKVLGEYFSYDSLCFSIQNMRRAGVLQKLLQDAFPVRMPPTEVKLQAIDLETTRPIFTLLAAGILLSILVLVIEIQIYSRR
jgi:hypothetical protein